VDAEFRLFLALFLVFGWVVLELTTQVAWLVSLLTPNCGAGKKTKPEWWVKIGYGVLFLLVVAYGIMGERGWVSLKMWMSSRSWFESFRGIWEVAVFFRPWYGGVMAFLLLWGVYRACGKYPASIVLRVIKTPFPREKLLFAVFSLWVVLLPLVGVPRVFENVLCGLWATLATLFVLRGSVALAVGFRARFFPFWAVLMYLVVVTLMLGESFLVMVWVTLGVGLVSDWFVGKKYKG
jgi:hypothetical protein